MEKDRKTLIIIVQQVHLLYFFFFSFFLGGGRGSGLLLFAQQTLPVTSLLSPSPEIDLSFRSFL